MKYLAFILIIIVTTVVAITMFLSVNNLRDCGEGPSDLRGCRAADAIVAVSGGDTPARTQGAIDLYKKGWGKKLIFSGAAYDKSGPSNAEVMRNQAVKQGIDADDILIDHTSETTTENAVNTTDIFKQHDIHSAILVTSSYHQKRTLLEFRRQAPDVEFRSYPSVGDNQWSVWWWTTPHGWSLALSEVVKIMIVYLGSSR